MAKRLTEGQAGEAYKLWCIGYTQEEIAEIYKVNPKTIYRTFKRRNMKKRKPPINPPKK